MVLVFTYIIYYNRNFIILLLIEKGNKKILQLMPRKIKKKPLTQATWLKIQNHFEELKAQTYTITYINELFPAYLVLKHNCSDLQTHMIDYIDSFLQCLSRMVFLVLTSLLLIKYWLLSKLLCTQVSMLWFILIFQSICVKYDHNLHIIKHT